MKCSEARPHVGRVTVHFRIGDNAMNRVNELLKALASSPRGMAVTLIAIYAVITIGIMVIR